MSLLRSSKAKTSYSYKNAAPPELKGHNAIFIQSAPTEKFLQTNNVFCIQAPEERHSCR